MHIQPLIFSMKVEFIQFIVKFEACSQSGVYLKIIIIYDHLRKKNGLNSMT